MFCFPVTIWVVPVRRKHRVIAKEDYTALEVSTPHLDDVVRFQDDTNRPDGQTTAYSINLKRNGGLDDIKI